MRRILFLALFFIPFVTFSQTRKPITGFFGVPFGSSTGKVKTELTSKGARFVPDSSSADFLLFTNINWQSRKNLYLIVRFVDDKAFEADLIFYNNIGAKAVENYNNVVKEVNEIYGLGQPNKNFTAPYREYDGKEVQAIAEGKAEYFTVWADFPNNGGLMVKILPAYYTALTFQNNDLLEEAAQKAGKN